MEQSKQQGGQPGTAQAAHSAIGTDFAAAVGPVSEHTIIRTDSDGLLAGEVSVMAGDRAIPVYRARPEGKSNLPVVLVVSEIFGVHAHIADVARRFAKLGYLALAPALFVRQGDPMSFASVASGARQVSSWSRKAPSALAAPRNPSKPGAGIGPRRQARSSARAAARHATGAIPAAQNGCFSSASNGTGRSLATTASASKRRNTGHMPTFRGRFLVGALADEH